MLETFVPLGLMWVIGFLKKHKTKIDHKTWGPLVNVAVGSAATVALGGDVSLAALKDGVVNGAKLAALAELGLAGTKSAVRISRVVKGQAAGGV